MVVSTVLGFPRIGAKRELKKATEGYWSGKVTAEELQKVGKDLRAHNWKLQKDAGVDVIPSNDFSFYDHILDASQLFNVVPERYAKYELSKLDEFFAMGRGLQRDGVDVPALEMVKWFDSNYHYVRPTFSSSTEFKLNTTKPVDEYLEAKELGIETRPVLIGPVSFLVLGKADKAEADLKPITLLSKLLPVYAEILKKLVAAGAKEIQIDEPVLVLDLDEAAKKAYKEAFEYLAKEVPEAKLIVASYFGDARPNLDAIKDIPVAGFHFDYVRNPDQLEETLAIISDGQKLSAGVVNGRNIWKTDFARAKELVDKAVAKLGTDRVAVATSSSLLHTPVDLENEPKLDPKIKDWFSFATQKLGEVVTIAKGVNNADSVKDEFAANAASVEARRTSDLTNDKTVQDRVSKRKAADSARKSEFAKRLAAQKSLNLPLFPTTTIGSFPQTKEIRIQRNKAAKGQITAEEYEKFIEKEIQEVIKFQDEVGLDVFVHGEPERNDMVQYFGEQLKGFDFTVNGWVQSYGSRYVRPPIVVGDVSRPSPMTVKESKYAQSVSPKPMKGMLTGPVTILRWSFPRDDISQKDQALQLAFALRDEVNDLEGAGVGVIQVDEPAIREGLPLRAGKERDEYVQWAPESFRIATSGVEDKTQIHSHFCYSDLDPNHIKALDADVVSIEFSKKDDSGYIQNFSNYPNHIGLGLFDIHSPRVPPKTEFEKRISDILAVYPKEKLWINPDCGLKTRNWEEVRQQLKNMVDAAKEFREKYA